MTSSSSISQYVMTSALLVSAAFWLTSDCDVAVAQRKKRIQIPDVQSVRVHSRDGVTIRCDYYPGGVVARPSKKKKGEREYTTRSGKQVVPVILLHGWEGRRSEYGFLASYLQHKGHAVIVPDLRGHGDSKTIRLASGDREIRLDRMRSAGLKAMVNDVDAVKKFLLGQNNEAALNIEMLCVVGAELGAILAVNWAAHDWSWPQLPTFKQGRDVKALVLLSPEQSFKGYTLNQALQTPVVRSRLSMMIVAAQDDRSHYSDAKSIHKRLQRFHKDVTDASEKDLYFLEPNGSLHGTQLVDSRWQKEIPAAQNINVFIYRRLLSKSEAFRWAERKSPLGDSN